MSSITIQPALDLIKLFQENHSLEEIEKVFYSTQLEESFHQFMLDKEVESTCLEKIFVEGFSTEGLDKKSAMFVDHARKILENKDRILKTLSEFEEEFEDIDKKAQSIARAYLPESANFSLAEIIFVMVPYDARVKEGRIYFDPLLATDLGKDGIIKFLAHEYHHSGRISIEPAIDLENTLETEKLIFSVFEMLELEGVADRVFEVSNLSDKIPGFIPLRDRREKVFDNFEEYLKKTQAPILSALDGKNDFNEFRDRLFHALFMKGENHPVGHRMAFEIEKTLGKEALVNCVASPSRFLKAYHKVAEENGFFRFDKKITDFVSSFEEKNYIKIR